MPKEKESAALVDNKAALGKQLDLLFGEELAKEILQDLAMVVAKHKLVHEPQKCELLFRYMIFVTAGWNSV